MEDFTIIIQRLQEQFFQLLPRLLISLFVLIAGYLFARLLKYLILRLFKYLDKLISRNTKDLNLTKAGSFLGTAFFWLVILAVLLIITEILGIKIITKWFESIIQYIPNIFAAIIIIFASILLGNLLSNLIISVSERKGLQPNTSLIKVVRFLLLFLAIIISMDQVGLEISLLIDIIDIVLASVLFGAALAFGLGSRTSVSNILASYYVRKSYKEGDIVQIGKTKGRIVKITHTNVVLINEIGRLTIPAKEFNETMSYLIKNN